MIYVKKWEKKEKEMSTKNNIFFNNHLQIKLFLNSIIFSEVRRLEEENMLKEILELRELLRIRREEEEKRQMALQNEEDGSGLTTPSDNIQPSEDAVVAEETPLVELPTEDSIKAAYTLKIKELMQQEPLILYSKYIDFFTDFDFNLSVNNIIRGLITNDTLFETKLRPLFLENVLNFSDISCSGNILTNPLLILFLTRLNNTRYRMFEVITKFKLNKLRFKRKKKLRKIHIIKKMKKITFFRKIKRKFFSNFHTSLSFFRNFSKTQANILVKRIPLSNRVVETTNVELFYKLNKHTKLDLLSETPDYLQNNFEISDDFLVYLRNYHQKPYLKLRKARLTHWNLFFNKTIRKQRYKGFLSWYIHRYQSMSYAYSFFVNFFTNFKISWFRTNKLESFFKTILIENYNNTIIKVPLLFSKLLKWKVLKQKNFYARKKVGKWSYLNFRRATCPWLQRKKNSPKVAKHLQPNLFYLNYLSNWDLMTGYVMLEEKLPQHSIPASDQFKVNFLLKLHMYRYKANTKCM